MRASALIVCVVGCGRIEFDSVPRPTDAGGLDLAAPFGAPVVVSEVGANVRNVSVSADLLEVYFTSNRGGGPGGVDDFWQSRRPALTAPWSTPEPSLELSSTISDSSVVLIDDLTVLITSDRAGGPGGHDVFRSTRADRTAPWQTPLPVIEVSSTTDEFHPRTDETRLHLVLSRGPGVSTDLFRASRASASSGWNPPQPIDELNTASNDGDPYLHDDGLTLYFASNRAGGAGGNDLYVARRTFPDGSFGAPVALTELNTSSNDRAPWISRDQRTLFFVSDRDGTERLYVSSR